MISAQGINEEGLIKIINDINELGRRKPSHYQFLTFRKKFDAKHKILASVTRHHLVVEFRFNGVTKLNFTRSDDARSKLIGSSTGELEVYDAEGHQAPNPWFDEKRDYPEHRFTTRCSREQFYDYIKKYPPFFEWLLWNQL